MGKLLASDGAANLSVTQTITAGHVLRAEYNLGDMDAAGILDGHGTSRWLPVLP